MANSNWGLILFRKRSAICKREKAAGYALITLLSLLTAGITLVLAVATVIFIYQAEAESKKICILSSYSQMTVIAKLMNELVGLNPEALELRTSENVTEMALAAATASAQAELVAALQLRLTQIRAARAALAAEQNLLKFSMQSQLSIAKSTTHSNLGRHIRRSSYPTLSIDTDGNDTAPQHYASDDFSEQITLNTKYAVDVLQIYSRLKLKQFLPFPFEKNHAFTKSCATTVENRGRQFYSTITSDQTNGWDQ